MNFEALVKKVDKAQEEGLPFVVYRKPDESLINAFIQKNSSLQFSEDYSGSGFIFAPFNNNDKSVLFADENSSRYRCHIGSEEFDTAQIAINPKQSRSATETKKQHLELVEKGIERIKKGDFIKVVLSRAEIVALEYLDITIVLKRLMSKYPSAFVYVWCHPDIGLWAGASPETLLKTNGDSFHTMALAGTQKHKDTIDVSWGEKEISEQQIVTDHIMDSLESQQTFASETYTRKAGNLLHLCTDIQGSLNRDTGLKELIEKLHPTAAVCGLPRNEVRNFIEKEEGYSRSYYTGFLGELNLAAAEGDDSKGAHSSVFQSSLFVNLRCMQLQMEPEPKAVIYVGGGVTIDSDPLSEWKETVDKSFIMKSVIGG